MDNTNQSNVDEKNFEKIFNHAAEGIVVAEIGSKKFYMGNPAICKMLGYTQAEFKKLGVLDIHPKKDLPYVLDQFKKQAEGSISLAKDLPVQKKDGTVFFADINSVPITLNGKHCVVGFFHDNTERKKNEERYSVLYKTSRDAIMILKPPSWRFVAGNPATIALFQCKDEKEFIALQPWQLSPEKQPDGQKSADKAKKMIMKAMEEGSNFFEWTHKKYRGENFFATVLLSRITEGKETYLQATVRDITAQKQMEQALQKSRDELDEEVKKRTQELEDTKRAILNVMADLREVSARNEAIVSSIAHGVIVVNKQGIIILMNQAAEKLLGWKVNEAIGKKWGTVLVRQDKQGNPVPPEKGAIHNALLGGATVYPSLHDSYYYVRKDGTRLPIVRSVSPVVIGKMIIGAVNVFRDVSHELEIDRMKTDFVSLASHQLRTPLTSIKWNLEMMLEKCSAKVNEAVHQYATEAYKSNEAMIELVNSLLNIGRMESGRLTIEPKETDLAALFRTVVEKHAHQIEEAKLTVKDNIPHTLPKISIDPQLISNVYANLLNNSIKYTPAGGGIELSIAKDGDFLVSTVKDSGIGIPVKEQKHIFERFFRGSNVSRAGVGSTGLGLYLAKDLVEASGGKIWLESTENKGSTFFFSLPVKGSVCQKGDATLSP